MENNKTSFLTFLSACLTAVLLFSAGFGSGWFLLNDRKDEVHQVELADEKIKNSKLYERINLLEQRYDEERELNRLYYSFLRNDKNSFEFIYDSLKSKDTTIIFLNEEIQLLKAKNITTSDIAEGEGGGSIGEGAGGGSIPTFISKTVKLESGEAYIDRYNGLIFSVVDVNIYGLVSGVITIPNKKQEKFTDKVVGDSWEFEDTYTIIKVVLKNVSYVGGRVDFEILTKVKVAKQIE